MTQETSISPELIQQTMSLLIRHEEDRKRAYLDIYGNITAGIGHNLSARDIEDDIRIRWARQDITEFYNNWMSYPWFKELNLARQVALIDFSFMGWKKVLGFVDMLKYLAEGNMEKAAAELLDSAYAKEVGHRANELADILVSGVIAWV
jgi:lysozyme